MLRLSNFLDLSKDYRLYALQLWRRWHVNEKEWTLHESHVILSANHPTYWVSDDDDDDGDDDDEEEEEDEDDEEEGHAAAADDDDDGDGDGDGDVDDDDDDGGAVDDVLGWRCNPMSECCYWY